MTMMSDIDQFQTQTATPVRAPINFATTMVALQRLGEQKYDDVYASTVKNRAAPPRSEAVPAPID